MQKNRSLLIDFFRGSALITIIFIHSLVPYLSQPDIHKWWNWAQYAVQIFVFCSAYVFFSHEITKKEKLFPYFIRRIKRLLLPYFIFLASFIFILLIIKPNTLSISYLFQSALLIGGVDVNWLVVLFIELTVVFQLIKTFGKKGQTVYYSLAAISSILLLFCKLPVSFKLIMWLPWSVIIVYAQHIVKRETNVRFHLATLVVSVIAFLFAFITLTSLGRSTTFFDNKYPPNLFYLSYGVIWISALYLFQPRLQSVIQKLTKPVLFFSTRSYSLFFIHTLVITVMISLHLQQSVYPISFFLSVFLTSICVQLVIDSFVNKFDTMRI